MKKVSVVRRPRVPVTERLRESDGGEAHTQTPEKKLTVRNTETQKVKTKRGTAGNCT